MTIFVPQASEATMLKLILNSQAQADPVLRLFVNNHTPVDGDTAAAYTEMSTQGYSAKTLTGASWTVTAGEPTSAGYAQQQWIFDGTGGSTSVYGYYITASGGLLLFAEVFGNGPYSIVNNGDSILVTPQITLDMTAS